MNGGICQIVLGVPICTCPLGYTGTSCETAVNYCALNPCQNGGICSPTALSYSCICLPGYSGINCQISSCKIKF